MYTKSLGVDNSKMRDSFFDLSVAHPVAVTESNQKAEVPLARRSATDHELNRDYRSHARPFAQFAHFCGRIKPDRSAYFKTADQAIGAAHRARRGAWVTSGCAAG